MARMTSVALLFIALPAFAGELAAGEPTAARQASLTELVRQDCGSCHGLTLKGGLGPSLEPTALADKDAGFLGYVILNGRRGTAMPPWREHLSEAEAQWIAGQLKKGLKK
jgi:cytochrome c55X